MGAAVSRLSAESMEELLVKIRDGEKGHMCGYGENKDSGVCQTQGHAMITFKATLLLIQLACPVTHFAAVRLKKCMHTYP